MLAGTEKTSTKGRVVFKGKGTLHAHFYLRIGWYFLQSAYSLLDDYAVKMNDGQPIQFQVDTNMLDAPHSQPKQSTTLSAVVDPNQNSRHAPS